MSAAPAAVTLRPATPDDAEALAHVEAEARAAAYRRLLPEPELAELADPVARYDALAERLGPGRSAVVAEVRDALCGFAVFGAATPGDPATGELAAVYVLPRLWRTGVGTLLVEESLRALVRDGYGEALAWVLARNRAAQRFFEAMRFHPDGGEQRGGMPQLRYRRTLPSPG